MRLTSFAILLMLASCDSKKEQSVASLGREGADCQVTDECVDQSQKRASAGNDKGHTPNGPADSSDQVPSIETLVCSAKKLRFSPDAKLLAIFSSTHRDQNAYNQLFIVDIECLEHDTLRSCVVAQSYMQDGPDFFPAIYWSENSAHLYVADHRGLGWLNASPSLNLSSRDFVTKVGKPGVISLKGRDYFAATSARYPQQEFDSLKVDLADYPDGSNEKRALESGGALLIDLFDRFALPDNEQHRIIDDSKETAVGLFGFDGVSLDSDSMSDVLSSRLEQIERERMLVRGFAVHSAAGRYALLTVDRRQTKHFSVGEDSKLLIDVKCSD